MINLIPIFTQNSDWLEVKKIIHTLNQNGEKAYLVGGCVRDALLNYIPKDFDIATSAKPDKLLKLFPHSHKQGKAFGVIAVGHSTGQIEVATFRKDGTYVDGRHPKTVEFLSEKEDVLRRDFTINALFYNLENNQIIDYVGGLKDLQKKIIRTVGEPKKRFQEDHLRILRAIRFSIRFNFKIESYTKSALLKMHPFLLLLSKERVYEECFKILQEGKFLQTLCFFRQLHLLEYFSHTLDLKQIDWNLCESFWAQKKQEDSFLKSASFIWIQVFYPLLAQQEKPILNSQGKWKKEFTLNLKNLKFPASVIKEMNQIFYSSACILDWVKSTLAQKLRIHNSNISNCVLLVSKNYLKTQKLNTDILDDLETEFQDRVLNGKLPPALINGNDLKKLGIPEDVEMANILNRLYDIQLEKKITQQATLFRFM